MKRIYLAAALLIAVFIMPSCTKDFLELEPKVSQLEANFYKTESDAMLSLAAVYDALSVQNWQFVPIMSDIKSDDAFCGGDITGSDMIQWQEQERFDIDGENAAVSALWSRCYSGIYRANQLLEKLDGIEWDNEDNRVRFEAEARFLRAYFYWDLARHYGWVPILEKVEADIEVLKSIPQSTPAEVYAYVAEDLTFAIENLPEEILATETGRVSKYAAQSLMARIFLYYDGFVKPVLGVTDDMPGITKAAVTAMLEDVIANSGHALLSNYADVFDWNNENNNEMVFAWQYDPTSGASDWGGWGINGNFSVIFQGPRDPAGDPEIVAGWSFGVLSKSLVDEFETGDPRKATTVYFANEKLTGYTRGYCNTGYFNYKFIPRAAWQATKGDAAHNYPINYPDIRFADVLLMAAELNLGTNEGKAVGYYNQVRTRALGSGAAKVTITIDDIYHERRVELAGEGHRWWDILRKGVSYAKTKIDASWTNVPTSGMNINPADFVSRPYVDDTYGMFPIPAGEVRNTNGSLQQFIPAFK